MDKKEEIDSKKLNQILRISSKILKKLYVFIFIISIYVSILIFTKLNIMLIILTILKILSPLFIGIVIAWLLSPIIRWLKLKNMNKILSTLFIYLIMIILLYLLFKTIIPIFIRESNDFLNLAPKLLDEIYDFINNIFSSNKLDLSIIKNEIFNVLNNLGTKMGKDIPITLVNVAKSIWNVLLGLIIGFYLLITDVSFIEDSLNKLSKDTHELVIKINEICRNYISATLFSSLLVFILSTIVFYIFGLKSALLFGFVCGITNIIPFIGPYIGAIIPVIVAFTKGISTGIIIVIMILLIQTIEGNIIHPIIMSKSIKVHPVTVIISLLVFGYFFGIVGMIIATPLVAILKELYFYLIKKYNSYKRKLVR